MSIKRYNGEALTRGTIVCRESMMTTGICSQPVEVVSETESMVVIKYLRDGDERRRKKSSILFVCDSASEGWAMHQASSDFLKAEMEIDKKQAKEKANRKMKVISGALAAAEQNPTTEHLDAVGRKSAIKR